MDIHQGPQAPGKLHYSSLTNVRQAACLMVLGFELEEKGICRHYDAEHPKSSGGVAHFHFKSHQAEEIQKLLAAYDSNGDKPTLDEREAIIVWMRQAIDSYHNIVYFLQHQATELVVTGGEPALDDEGNVIGKQGFQVKVLKKNAKR